MKRLHFSSLLRKHCEVSRLYLHHDLTLTQLAEAIGTNRTYLSAYFAQKGITFNIYINRLRIQHFERLYNKAVAVAFSFNDLIIYEIVRKPRDSAHSFRR